MRTLKNSWDPSRARPAARKAVDACINKRFQDIPSPKLQVSTAGDYQQRRSIFIVMDLSPVLIYTYIFKLEICSCSNDFKLSRS